jgi:NAD(P)-dependent dehydrogenase (short-subunit alcohol dehydrogenase family)
VAEVILVPGAAPAPDALAGRVVAITGATGGIGRAVALAAAAHGARVILLGRNVRKLAAVHAEVLAKHGDVALMAPLDLEKALAGDYDRIAAAVLEHYGRLDGLVHCAGLLGALTPIEGFEVPLWCKVLHVNLTAPFALTQVLMPALRRSPSASVIFTSSSVGRQGRAFWGAYAASKFALEGLSQVLADETRDITSIRVNTLNPGRVRTVMRRQAYPSEDLAGLAAPEDIVLPYIALLSDATAGVTGGSFNCQPAPPQGTAPAS